MTPWQRLRAWLARRAPAAGADPTAVPEPDSNLPPWSDNPGRRLTRAEALERARPRPAPPWELEAQRQANRDALADEAQAIRRRYAKKRGK